MPAMEYDYNLVSIALSTDHDHDSGCEHGHVREEIDLLPLYEAIPKTFVDCLN